MKKLIIFVGSLILLLVPHLSFSQTLEDNYAEYMAKESYQEIDTSGTDSINCDILANQLICQGITTGLNENIFLNPGVIVTIRNDTSWGIFLTKDTISFECYIGLSEIPNGELIRKNGHWWYYTTKNNRNWAKSQLDALKEELK
jgi:hypothetical protein